MAIDRHDLEKMNDLLGQGMNISDVAKKYPKYDYWEIYWEVNDYSLLGKKRSILSAVGLKPARGGRFKPSQFCYEFSLPL